MRARDSVITTQGVLSLMAVAVMLGYAAYALQLVPRQTATAYAEDRQQTISSAIEQAGPDASNPAVFTGTIVQSGASFLLRESAGAVYRLDDSSRAQKFAGLPVKVTGKLDPTLKVIRVVKIEETRA